jgi:hypothetical protein
LILFPQPLQSFSKFEEWILLKKGISDRIYRIIKKYGPSAKGSSPQAKNLINPVNPVQKEVKNRIHSTFIAIFLGPANAAVSCDHPPNQAGKQQTIESTPQVPICILMTNIRTTSFFRISL